MNRDLQVVLLLSIAHLLAGGVMVLIWWRVAAGEREANSGGGGGNENPPENPRSPQPPSDGLLPLPEAQRASIRLRGEGRLADLIHSNPRQPAHKPKRVTKRTPTKF